MSLLKKLEPILIGLLKVLSLQSKTKVNADHAGLSQPLVFLNLLPDKMDKVSAFLNNNLLIAQAAMEIKDATEDGHHLL